MMLKKQKNFKLTHTETRYDYTMKYCLRHK